MAACPTLILLTSDSLNATVIVNLCVLTISAKFALALLDDDDDDPVVPRLPAVVAPDPLAVAPLPEEPLLVELELDPEDTESPGDKLSSDTIVPLTGARNLVCLRAVFALCTLASALYIEACADAMLDAEDVVDVVPDPLAPEPLAEAPEAGPPLAAGAALCGVVAGVDVAGVVDVVGVIGVVGLVAVVGVVVVVGVVGVVGVVVVVGVVGVVGVVVVVVVLLAAG